MNRVTAVGNKLFSNSHEIKLRGANLVRYNWKYPDGSYSIDHNIHKQFIRRPNTTNIGWNANCITLWIDSNPILNNNPPYMLWLNEHLDIAEAAGTYIILSWHSDTGQGSHPARITDRGFQVMALLARRYKSIPNIIYACQAEPGFWTSSVSRWRELRDQQEHMVDVIRAEDPEALIGVSGTNWSQDVHWLLDNPILRDNIFIKPHIYGSLQTFLSRKIPELAERWPIIIGEFGTGGRMSNNDSRDIMRYADESLSGYQAWNLSDIGPPVMLSSISPITPNTYGSVVKDELQRRVATPPPEPPKPSPVIIPFRINAGGAEYQDETSAVWLLDQPWREGITPYGYLPAEASSAIHGNHPLLETERWGLSSYKILTPPGTYDILLHLGETWEGITGPDQRVFVVSIGDQSFLVDPFSGSQDRQLSVTFSNITVEPPLTIEFEPITEHPILKAIEIITHEPPGSPPPSDEIDQLRDQVASLTKEIQSLNSEINALSSEKTRLSDEVDLLFTHNQSLIGTLDQIRAVLDNSPES